MQLGILLGGTNPVVAAQDAIARFLFWIWRGFAHLANLLESVFRQLAGLNRVYVATDREDGALVDYAGRPLDTGGDIVTILMTAPAVRTAFQALVVIVNAKVSVTKFA